MKLFTRGPSLATAGLLAAAFVFTVSAATARPDEHKEKKAKKAKHHQKAEVRAGHAAVVTQQSQSNFAREVVATPQVRVSRSSQAVVGQQAEYGGDGQSRYSNFDRNDPVYRRTYYSRPRSSFSISLGDGYAGRGYYYGPRNSPYYYDAPGVTYYRSEAMIPSRYRGYSEYNRNGYDRGHASIEIAVQSALARRGYYRGAIDGQIGAGSRRAIARFQGEQGLRPTGRITRELTVALGI